MSILTQIYSRIAYISPNLEVKLRQFYWNNHTKLAKFNPNISSIKGEKKLKNKIEFDDVLLQLRNWGVGEGSLLIVHSSYEAIKNTGLTPTEIINKLLELVGKTGTLVMPVIRYYKNEPKSFKKIDFNFNELECVYNIRNTPVSSGILPSILMRISGAEISKHPLNPLCAVGPLAKEMMFGNIDGELPSPHGPKSSWKFCLDNNAKICGLGVSLRHYNTMSHVAEEAFNNWYWSDEEWYNQRRFIIESTNEVPIRITVKERKHKWGMLHLAEFNRYRDLLNNNIIKTTSFGSVILEIEDSQSLISFLKSKNSKGYPYFL